MQIEYNKKNHIIPKTIIKTVDKNLKEIKSIKHIPKSDLKKRINNVGCADA